MTECEELVQDYWAGKPESERLLVTPTLTSMRMQDNYSGCLAPPLNAACLVASPSYVDYGNLCRKPCIFTLRQWRAPLSIYVQCIMPCMCTMGYTSCAKPSLERLSLVSIDLSS